MTENNTVRSFNRNTPGYQLYKKHFRTRIKIIALAHTLTFFQPELWSIIKNRIIQ
jgi:hypothetical protein